MHKKTKYKVGKLILDIYKNGSHYSINSLKATEFKFDNRTLYRYGKGLLVFFDKKNKYGKSRKLIYISTKTKNKILKMHPLTFWFIHAVDCYDLFYDFILKDVD